MKTVIVGGVAGGMAAATRLRRLTPSAQIVVLERSQHVSYANCGLPYYAGGVIPERSALLLQTPESLRSRFDLDVRVGHEVISIDREQQTATIRDLSDGHVYAEPYDHLILATGAAPIVPPIPGVKRALTLRTVEDVDALMDALNGARTAVVIGGGFVGLEAAENLHERGLQVTVVEKAPHVLAPLDVEMVVPVHAELLRHGVGLELGAEAAEVTPDAVRLTDGRLIPAELVVLAIGVLPDSRLAREAGLSIGERGGIVVDETQRTSDPTIFAVGDAAEKKDAVDGAATLVPLANIANRSGRRAADAIAGHALPRVASPGTAVVKVFDVTVAVTGWNERRARAAGLAHHVIHTHPLSHAGYYPGAQSMSLKLLTGADGGILGAQAVGGEGVDKRIDVIATAMRAGLTAPQLADLDLAYAPPYGSAKDPVNMLGYIAENRLSGATESVQWHELAERMARGAQLVDVRTPAEHAAGHIPGAVNVELDTLRFRLDELGSAPVIVHCAVGQRAHSAAMLLHGHGYRVANLDGGFNTWQAGISATPSDVRAASAA